MPEQVNKFLEFYRKYSIAPCNKEQEDWTVLKKKRTNLYRQLGIPVQCFKGKNILEFGPGSGNNALAMMMDLHGNLNFGEGHIDLVEPNLSGRNDLERIFNEKSIPRECYTIYSEILEEFKKDKEYDFVIAEGFLTHISNWKECIEIIKKYTAENGIVIITCADTIGQYIERTKRLVGHYIARNIDDYKEKVGILTKIFEPQLKSLSGRDRPSEDWVQEQFFNDALLCAHPMNINDAIDAFGDGFDILGASQNIFTDHSWYKDLDYDYISEYKKQYNQKKHMFLLAGIYEESIRTEKENEALEEAVIAANELAAKFEETKSLDLLAYKEAIDNVAKYSGNKTIQQFNQDTLELLKMSEKSTPDLRKFGVWSRCFGKACQYISFVRKENI